MARLRSLVAGLLRRRRVEAEVADEIRFHIEARTAHLVAEGIEEAEARRRARLEFGSIERYKEEVRGARGLGLVDEMRADLRAGLRGLRRTPGFTLAAGLSLALGIGANTLVFSLLDSTLLRPLPLPEPDRLVTVWNLPDPSRPEQLGTSSIARFMALRDEARSFESVAAHNGLACGIKTLGFEENGVPPERVLGQTVSPSMFRTLGVAPMLGRTFTDDEDRVDEVARVLVLTHRMWQRRFGGDPAIVGKVITFDRLPTTIVGVLPASFDLFGDRVEFFAPLCLTRVQVESRVGGNTVIARLRRGVTMAQAQAEIDALIAQLAASDPARHGGLGARIEPLQRSQARLLGAAGQPNGDYATPLLILQGAVGFVMLIACANVAGLLLARTAGRRAEVAVRTSLGASWGRVIRQLITETLPLAGLGALGGVALAWGGVALFRATAPPEFPRLDRVAIDLRTLAFTALIVLASAALFAVAPAIQASKVGLLGAVRSSSRGIAGGTGRRRARAVLVAAQVALALVLLTGAGLLITSFARVLHNELGGDPANVLTFDFRFPQRGFYQQLGMRNGTGLFSVSPVPAETTERVLERLESLPGLVSVAAANRPPFGGGTIMMPFHIEGRPLPPAAAGGASGLPAADFVAVTRGFFDAMRIPLRGGRAFDARDTAAAPFVVIVSETVARQHFPNEDPIGKYLRFDFLPEEPLRQIVGVAGDTLAGPFQSRAEPTIYVPHLQQTGFFVGPQVVTRIAMTFVARTFGSPMAMLMPIKRAVAEIDHVTPVANAMTVEQTLDAQVRHLRLYTLLLAIFGAVSVVLAAIGIYGVMAHAVAERTAEIGIRMALGARVANVLGMILRQAAVVIGAGLAVGLAASVALGRLIESSLFQVTRADPASYVAASALLLLVAALACAVPTRRAVTVSPTTALKYE